MLLKSLCPCRGFSFRAYVQPIVQPGGRGFSLVYVRGSTIKTRLLIYCTWKKRRRKKKTKQVKGFTQGWWSGSCFLPPQSLWNQQRGSLQVGLFFSSYLFIYFLKIWIQFNETNNNEINGLNRRDHKLCRPLGGKRSSADAVTRRRPHWRAPL